MNDQDPQSDPPEDASASVRAEGGATAPVDEDAERLRPHRAEEEESEGEVSASVRAGGGTPAPRDEDADSQPEGAGVEAFEGDGPGRPSAELKAILEALIFASPEPLSPKAMQKLLNGELPEDVLTALAELKQDYERPGGLQLVEVAGGFQIVTRADLNDWVRRLFQERSTQKLSVQSLETLAVIAYRQPITSVEIAEVRGVNTSGVLNTLLERHLIKIVGRKQVVGRPFLYATTKEFLIRFGLNELGDLPKVEDMSAALGLESQWLVEQTPSEDQLPIEEPEGDDTNPSGVGPGETVQ